MKISQTPVFRVPAGTQTEQALSDDAATRAVARRAWTDFCVEFGGDRLFSNSRLAGITFEGEKTPPAGWVRCKDNRTAWRPSLSRPLSEAARKFNGLPEEPDMVQFLRALGLDVVPAGGKFYTPGYKKVDGVFYLTAQPGCPVPDEVLEVTGEERAAVLGGEDDV